MVDAPPTPIDHQGVPIWKVMGSTTALAAMPSVSPFPAKSAGVFHLSAHRSVRHLAFKVFFIRAIKHEIIARSAKRDDAQRFHGVDHQPA